jgi:hypothetical protein
MGVAGEDGGYDLRLVGAVGDSGHRFSIASRESVIGCTMLEPRLADWLRETGRWIFSAGTGSGLVVAFCGEDFRENGRRNVVFDGEFVVNCVVDVVT